MTNYSPISKISILSWGILVAVGCSTSLLMAQASSPTQILVCESTNSDCSRSDARFPIAWTFDGATGSAKSSTSGDGARLTIEKYDSGSLVVRAVNQSGPSAGLTALYTGSISGKRIAGTVEWSWAAHPDFPAHGTFSGIFQDQVAPASTPTQSATAGNTITPENALPHELLVCENGGLCNAAWMFKGSAGTGVWFARNPTRATLTVVRAEPDYLMIRRTDTTDGVTATYTGSPRGDHWGGTIVWNSGHPGQATGTWIAFVPKTDCSGRTDLEPADAMLTGQYALMFKRDRDALTCYLVAAKAGDATAEAAVGMLYYQGRGAAGQDYKEAFFWLHRAADQGVYAAQRTVAEMYTAGQGTQRDPTLAGIYTARADEQKHDLERRQDFEERAQARREEHAERAADRVNQLFSSFVLGASFGLFF